MCQWKFLVFRYSANTSARIAFMAPAMSLVAERVRSVGVASGAPRSCRRSEVFVGLFRFMLFFLCMGLILFRCRLGRQRQKHVSRPYRHAFYTPIAPVFHLAPFNPRIAAFLTDAQMCA